MIHGSPLRRATSRSQSGEWPVQRHAHPAGLVMVAPPCVDATRDQDERWPAPVATLFIVSTSLALWGGIFWVARLLFG